MNFGIIGCGGIADRRTIPGMLKSNKIDVVAVEDASEIITKKIAKKYNIFNEDDLMRDDTIEAVYIGTPLYIHSEQVIKAADFGKHILCEKPLAISIEETKKIIEYCYKKNVTLQVGFMMRYSGYQDDR